MVRGSSQSSYGDDSDEARQVRHIGKTVVNFTSGVATKVAGPLPSLAVGGAATLAGEIGHKFSSGETDDAWKYTGDLGREMLKGAATGMVVDKYVAPVLEGSSSSFVKGTWELWKEFEEKVGKDASMTKFHEYHRGLGKDYCSFCDVCKS